MIAPAIIKPMRCGIFNLFNINGANKMIKRMSENNNTGFLSGKVMSNMESIIMKQNYCFFSLILR
jgi:hypothetical protein